MAGPAGSRFGPLPDAMGSVEAVGETPARLRWAQDPAAALGWRAEGSAQDKLPLFGTRSTAARRSQCPRYQVRHGVAISLRGAEPGSGGRTAISLCRRTGCAELPADGAYPLRHAVKIR